jgi:hypothetical protein
VGHAEGQVGVMANPEQIHSVTSEKNLDSLIKGLQESQTAGAGTLEAGASAPFLILSLDYPDDIAIKTFRLRPELGTRVAGKP